MTSSTIITKTKIAIKKPRQRRLLGTAGCVSGCVSGGVLCFAKEALIFFLPVNMGLIRFSFLPSKYQVIVTRCRATAANKILKLV